MFEDQSGRQADDQEKDTEKNGVKLLRSRTTTAKIWYYCF